jgi:hypothetical protein
VSTPDRMDPALQGGDGAITAAHQEREQRLAADIAAMQAGPTKHAAGLTDHHQGSPSVQEQMLTHTPAPKTPDTGGHQSASDPIC